MKGYLTTVCVIVFSVSLVSCFKKGKSKGLPDDGQLHGVAATSRPSMGAPLNMVFIPPGTFHMGPSDEDISYNYTTRNRQVSIPGFWMDKTEITNNDYRQFVTWVRDSLAFKILFGPGINKTNDTMAVDWKKVATIKYDRNTIEKLNELNLAPDNRLYGKPEIDPDKLAYRIEYYDLAAAAKRDNAGLYKSNFIIRADQKIYPDTLVWIRKFTPIHWCG